MRPPRTLRTSSAVSVAVSAAFVVAFSPWSVAAQDATQAFGDVVDVRVVNLEVVVTDDDGRVSGLAPEDFVLEVDGRPVPLEFFTEVRDGTAVARDQSTAAALPALEPGQLVGTSYLLFIDEYFSIAQDRDQVLDGLINQLTGLRVTDRMAVVAYTGEDVEMLQNWTDNVPRLVESLRRAKRRDTYGLQWRTEGLLFEPTNEESGQRADPLTGEIDEPSGRDSVFEARLEEKIYARRVEDQVSRAVAAATATLRGFASPPGRKIMLLLSGGWPDDPGAWVLQDTSEFLDNAGILTGDDLLGPLASTANRLGFTIYPIDVPGLRTIGIDAESATLDTPNSAIIGPEDGSAPSFGNQTGRRQEQEEHFALLALAQSTGGEAYLNQSRLGALEQVVADTRSYYWLGFTPTWRGDDSEHRVDVRLNRPGLTVRARRGFVDLSRENEVTMMTESALLFGDLPAAYPLEVKVGEGRRAGWGKREVPVAVKIPADVITFLPSAEGYVTELELRVAVIDENEERAEVPMVPMVLRTQRLPEEGEFHVHHTVLKMRKGEHQVVVSLYDRFSGKILTARLAVPAA